jgi:hypothetical protein
MDARATPILHVLAGVMELLPLLELEAEVRGVDRMLSVR